MGRRSTMPPAKPPPLITVHHPSRRSQCVLQTTSPTSPTKPPTTNHSTTPIASPVPPTPLTTTLPSTNIPKLPTYNNNHSIHPYLYRSHLQFTYQELKHATPVKIQVLNVQNLNHTIFNSLIPLLV
ncbi:hypothetical protein D5086_032681 [Populus alba]|uniref:Uncharacterized protein n=1 Tax=Populus alba TaxID=43335 RepID=A0ACC4AEQ3_POPAL